MKFHENVFVNIPCILKVPEQEDRNMNILINRRSVECIYVHPDTPGITLLVTHRSVYATKLSKDKVYALLEIPTDMQTDEDL